MATKLRKNREKFARFDAADYLAGEADIVAYLDAAAEEADPALMASAFGAVARAQHESSGARFRADARGTL